MSEAGEALAPLGPADVDVAAALHAAAFADAWDARALAALVDAGAWGFVAAAGFVLCRACGDECEILTIAVVPGARRRGLGRRLVGAALARARADGLRRMVLEVADDNAAARALYAGHGFAAVGRRRGYYAGASASAGDALILARDVVAAADAPTTSG